MTNELKPCPLCGCTPKIEIMSSGNLFVSCQCGLQTSNKVIYVEEEYGNEESVCTSWNSLPRRTDSIMKLQSENEELRNENKLFRQALEDIRSHEEIVCSGTGFKGGGSWVIADNALKSVRDVNNDTG